MRTFFIAGLRSALFLLGPSLLAAQIQGGQDAVQQPDQTATAPDTARVTVLGVVRNAATGEPLPRTLVRIEGDADTGTLTNGEGKKNELSVS